MEAVLYLHHLLTVPEGLQKSTQTRALSIPFQCDEKAFPVHGVIVLPEVQEYQEGGGSWAMLPSSWAIFNSIISVPDPHPALKPWRTFCICTLAHRQVSISASATFHRVSNIPMPRVGGPLCNYDQDHLSQILGDTPFAPHVLY